MHMPDALRQSRVIFTSGCGLFNSEITFLVACAAQCTKTLLGTNV